MKFSWTIFSLIVLFSRVVYPQESPPTFWIKMSDSTAYSPRDSSPNASVVHDGAIWILAGWRNDNDTLWYSKSDVWRSPDGIVWELVNENPPYLPYSAFVSFNGFIWTFGSTSFMSSDGVTWDTVQTNIHIGEGSKAVVFQDEIWLTNGTSVFRSEDGFSWETVLMSAPWNYRVWPGFHVFHDKLWFFGGGINYLTGNDYYFNDVWSSEDGYEWVLETQSAAWPGRYWFGSQVYDDKIWILGGWNYYDTDGSTYGNRNDTWYTENGVDWFLLPTENSWPERHAPFVWVFDGSMWISSGYGSLGKNTLYNDVWKLTNSWKDTKAEQTIAVADTLVYGMPLPLDLQASSGLEVQSTIEDDSPSNTIAFANGEVIPGEYTLYYENQGNSIFARLDTSITIFVKKKDLLISVADYYRLFGAPNPHITLQFDGFVYADDETSIEELPIPVIKATPYSPEGVYEIGLEGGYSSRYNLATVTGHLHVKSSELDIVYYPNPVVSDITINLSKQRSASIHLMSSTGQILKEFLADKTPFSLNLKRLGPGIYFLRVISENTTEIHRFVKL